MNILLYFLEDEDQERNPCLQMQVGILAVNTCPIWWCNLQPKNPNTRGAPDGLNAARINSFIEKALG